MQTLNIYVEVYNATQIRLSYSFEEWKQFITCVIDNNQNFETNSTFSMRVLLQSNGDGLQAIEFPYPDFYPPNADQQVVYMINGLYAYSNYSIRVSFSTSNRRKQLFTSGPVLLKTFGRISEDSSFYWIPMIFYFMIFKTNNLKRSLHVAI